MDEVIKFEGKALGSIIRAMRVEGLNFYQAYIWYALGYAKMELGYSSTQVNTSAYADYLMVSIRTIREALVVLRAKGLIERVEEKSSGPASYRWKRDIRAMG